MKIKVQKIFEKDIEQIKNKRLAIQVQDVLANLEVCNSVIEIKNLKMMKAKGQYFRIKIGSYRLGLKLENECLKLLRFMHRKDIYKYFP